ncbi:MAG TPA: hypothetical protein PKC43_11490 [Phycisphaerales bacterium]|nr:hypothetical protein [Phycisphaerales bacterium]HMP38055.1 hypothetical protein [Phycisphaerales bacterium]
MSTRPAPHRSRRAGSTTFAAGAAGALALAGAGAAVADPPTDNVRTYEQEAIGLDAASLIAPPETEGPFKVIVAGTTGYQFRTDLDSGGDFALTRFAAGAQFRAKLAERISLGVELGYRFERYSFGGDVFPGLGSGFRPWRDIHTVSLGIVPTFALDDRWTLSAGFIGQAAGEAQADVDDSTSLGGLVGVAYRVSDTLILGGGVAIVSPIEDDVKVFPTFLVEWKINEQLRVASRGGPTNVLGGGVELVYQPQSALEFAFGARWEYNRFRLTEDGSVPKGIGEVEGLPLWLRASWWPTDRIRLDLLGGVTVAGEMKLSDRDGGVLASSDFDPAPFVGLYLIWSF